MSSTPNKILLALNEMKSLCTDISTNVFTSVPNALSSKVDDYIILSVPAMLQNSNIGKDAGVYKSYVRFEFFRRDKNGLEDTPKLTRMLEDLSDKLPHSANHITLSNPRIVLRGSAGNGFHAAALHASIIINL